jgi:capsular polysaccharide biosynthesis protein
MTVTVDRTKGRYDFADDQAGTRVRFGAVLLRGLVVVCASLAVAAVVFVVSHAIHGTYSSSSTVAVNVSGSDINDTSLGADNLASQYAQQVNATPVLQQAGTKLDGAGIPSGSISGGAVGAQNAIAIKATASSASLAEARATAVANAFVAYVDQEVTRQAAAYVRSATTALKPLAAQIADVQSKLAARRASASSSTAALEEELGTLTAQRAAALASIAETSVAGGASVTIVGAASSGVKTAPKPTLYALVGFLVGLLITGRLAFYLAARKQTSA